MPPVDPAAPVRIDKWLWAARFMKTRALAADAVKAGRVHVNGDRVKPSRDVRVGDRLEITIGQERRSIVVRASSPHRGPASQAALLYEETAESLARREELALLRRLTQAQSPTKRGGPRPTKRERRRFDGTIDRGRP